MTVGRRLPAAARRRSSPACWPSAARGQARQAPHRRAGPARHLRRAAGCRWCSPSSSSSTSRCDGNAAHRRVCAPGSPRAASRCRWALKVDTLTAVMMLVVTVVSAMVHVYSIGYMSHDPSIPRFMAYLSLFTFFMLMLVTADNLVQMFFGWEGRRPRLLPADRLLVRPAVGQRRGDQGLHRQPGRRLRLRARHLRRPSCSSASVQLDTDLRRRAGQADTMMHVFGGELHALTLICLLLFVGAMGKSAQLGLHTWLPDAMEGPTPVSALIHAATMVTAGVFMVARLSPMFEYRDRRWPSSPSSAPHRDLRRDHRPACRTTSSG